MSDRFDLEEKIMSAWAVVDDIKLLFRRHCETQMTCDQVDNCLMGMAEIYQARFEELFESFEKMIRAHAVNISQEHVDETAKSEHDLVDLARVAEVGIWGENLVNREEKNT